MASFSLVAQLTDPAKYAPLLKAALNKVTAEAAQPFEYFAGVVLGGKKVPVLLVDYNPTLPAALPGKPAATAKGTVTLTADGLLKFSAQRPVCEALQKFLAALKVPQGVFIPAEEATPNAGTPTGAAAKTPAAPGPGTSVPAGFARTTPTQSAAPTKAAAPVAPTPPGATPAKANPPQPTAAPGGFTRAAVGATAAKGPQNIASARPPAKPGASPTMTREEAGRMQTEAAEHKAQQTRLNARIAVLAKVPWPGVKDEAKNSILVKMAALVKSGKFKEAELNLTKLRKHADPNAQKLAKVEGVPDWFLNRAERKVEGEKLVEEGIALKNLIQQKTADNDVMKANWAPMIKDLEGVLNRWYTANDAATACDDPNEMQAIYEQFQAVQADKKKWSEQIRPLWIEKQQSMLRKEMSAIKNSNSSKLVAGMGEEAFLEMAQMSEIIAKKSGKGFDPYNAKKSNGRLLQDLEMAEVAAVYGYSTQDFTTVNGIMRGMKTNPADEKPSSPDAKPGMDYRPYIEACKSALNKLPVFQGTVVRCEKTLYKTVVDSLLQSGTRSDAAFMSAGLTKVPGFGSIVTTITGVKTGREITMLSLHEKEGEVLFPPGAKFKFVSYKNGTTFIDKASDLTEDLLTNMTAGEFEFTEV